MSQLVVAPLLVALVAAILSLVARRLGTTVYRGVSVLGVLAYAVAVAALVRAVLPDHTLAYQLGDWPAPFGITLVADPLSAFMLSFTAIVAVASLVFSVRYVDDYGQRVSFHPLFHFMLLGVTGAFLTGDIFNLFVWFEVMLMASYVLVVFYSGPEHTRAALQYVVLNLVGSALMLVAIGGIYAVTGTLNMADIARRLSTADPAAAAPVLGLSAVLFAVFALKAGVVPFQFWVPPAYRAAPAPVTAMLAGVVKKVGVYAIVRLYFTVFAAAPIAGLGLPGFAGTSPLGFYGPVLLALAAASIVFGGFAAISRSSMSDLLAYSSIGQIGFILVPLAVAATVPGLRVLGVAAALVYALNHALAKSLLFLVAGTVRDATGTDSFADLGGLAGRSPVLAASFLVGGLALVGIPPLTGFFGKLLVFDALAQGGSNVGLAAALGGAILTIGYVSSAWNRGFWGDPSTAVARMRVDRVQLAVIAGLALCIVGVGVGFDPAVRFAEAAAGTTTDAGRDAYVSAVLGGDGA